MLSQLHSSLADASWPSVTARSTTMFSRSCWKQTPNVRSRSETTSAALLNCLDAERKHNKHNHSGAVRRANCSAHADRLALSVRGLLQDHVAGVESQRRSPHALDFNRLSTRREWSTRRNFSSTHKCRLDRVAGSQCQSRALSNRTEFDSRSLHKSRTVARPGDAGSLLSALRADARNP